MKPVPTNDVNALTETLMAKAAALGMEHGGAMLPEVEVVSYNVELEDDEGFVGDRASKGAFRDFIEDWRKPMRQIGHDPFEEPTAKIAMERLDALLSGGDPIAAGIVQSAVESFAQNFYRVVQSFLKLKKWKDAERFVIGGGFSGSRVGKLAIGRASVLLRTNKAKVEMSIIHNDPDEAGLIGAAHLAPAWMLEAHDSILAIDIGGTNIRVGIVRLALDLSKVKVWKFELWRYVDEKLGRDDAVEGIVKMLKRLINRAKKHNRKLAPFIGIACPGKIEADGSIAAGGQNLPGNWESSRFNLPAELRQAIPRIGEHETTIVMHNDAVVQGLSEMPYMKDVSTWGAFTIGTGLGNALFVNRSTAGDRSRSR